MKKKDEIIEETVEEIDQERRKALSRMGFVATAAYATPVLMTLSSSAKAHGSEKSEMSEASEASEMSEMSEASEMSEMSEASEMSEMSEASEMSEMSKASEMSEMS